MGSTAKTQEEILRELYPDMSPNGTRFVHFETILRRLGFPQLDFEGDVRELDSYIQTKRWLREPW
jgi:hypothetical protein